MSGESSATLCLFAWCQAEREAEFFVEDKGDGARTDNGEASKCALVEASKCAFRRWDARLTLAVWRATAARASGPGVRIVKKSGVSQERGCPSPGDGGVRTSISFLSEREVGERNWDPSRTTTPQGVFVCDHDGFVINRFCRDHTATGAPHRVWLCAGDAHNFSIRRECAFVLRWDAGPVAEQEGQN